MGFFKMHKEYRNINVFFLFFSLIIFSTSLFARPIYRITADQSSINLSGTGTANINFTVRNVSGRALTIDIVKASGYDVNALRSIFTANSCLTRLANNASCNVSTRIQAKGVDSSTSFEVEICSFNGAICSGMRSKIAVTVETNSGNAQISLMRSPLSIQRGGGEGSIVVTNNSSATALNIRSNFTGTALQGRVTETGNTCQSLAPNTTCLLTFRAGNNNVAQTNFSISGDNTNTATGAIRISNLFAYIPNIAIDAVGICPVNVDGSFGVCIDSSNVGLGFNTPNNVAVNNDGTFAYVANGGNGAVYVCPINPANGDFNGPGGGCADSGVGAIFTVPAGLTLNRDNTLLTVVDNGANEVRVCDVNANTWLISNCRPSPANFNGPGFVSFSSDESTAYVTEANRIRICQRNLNTGLLSDCENDDNVLNLPTILTFNRDYTNLYTGSFAINSVTVCPINADGSLGDCDNSGATGVAFNIPVGSAFSPDFDILYVASQGSNQILRCPVNPDGSLGFCQDSGAAGVPQISPNGVTMVFRD